MKWFRFYHSLLDSVKVRTLPDPAQVDYTLLLCCASEFRERTNRNTGETGLNIEEAAWRMRRASLETSLPLLIDRGLARFDDAALIVLTGWTERQRASDDSAQRQRKRYDETRNQDLGAGSRETTAQPHVRPHVRAAAPDTDTDTDTTVGGTSTVATKPHSAGRALKTARPAEKKGTRLAADWVLPRKWGEWALAQDPTLTPDDVRRWADKFRNHWVAKTKDATKLDWRLTWYNWIHEEIDRRKRAPPAGTKHAERMRIAREMQDLGSGEADHGPQADEPRDITGEAKRIIE